MAIPAPTRTGATDANTRDSFQLFTKAITKPATNVVMYWRNKADLSPIPDWIFSVLLQRGSGGKVEVRDSRNRGSRKKKTTKKQLSVFEEVVVMHLLL